MAISAEMYEAIIKIVDQRVGELKVTHEDFSALRESVHELAEAQRRTEERLDRLSQSVEALAEAQRRTDESVKALAEAQRRTDERVSELAEAQRRTEESLKALAEAQRGTEESVRALSIEVRSLAQQVGRLSDTVGYGLEDVAKVMLPAYLSRHYGLPIIELDRKFFPVDRDHVEMDLYGEGKHDGQEIVVVGECKSRIYEAEVEKFAHELELIESQLVGMNRKVFKVLFGYFIHPSAHPPAKENDILLVASYQR